jgi:hypothetical protein
MPRSWARVPYTPPPLLYPRGRATSSIHASQQQSVCSLTHQCTIQLALLPEPLTHPATGPCLPTPVGVINRVSTPGLFEFPKYFSMLFSYKHCISLYLTGNRPQLTPLPKGGPRGVPFPLAVSKSLVLLGGLQFLRLDAA